MRLTALLLFLFISFNLRAQQSFAAKKIDNKSVPAEIKYQGKFLEAWKWKDIQGDNLLLMTKKTWRRDPHAEDDQISAEIYAYLFSRKDSGYKVKWKLADFVRECPVDISLSFFKNGVAITDLDKDSLAEVTLVYKLSCKGDVSPDQMKLIMREGTDKYALRGTTCDPGNGLQAKPCRTIDSLNLEQTPAVTDEWDQYLRMQGRYESEKDFMSAPQAFLPFARKHWLKFINKVFD